MSDLSNVEILVFFLSFVQGGTVMAGFVLVGAMRQLKTEANQLLKHIESVKRQCLRQAEDLSDLARVNIAKTEGMVEHSIAVAEAANVEIKGLRSRIEEINNRVAVNSIKR